MTVAKVNDLIRLVEMPNDPDPIPVGTFGIVTEVFTFTDCSATIEVDWQIEPKRYVNVIEGVDTYHVIPPEEQAHWQRDAGLHNRSMSALRKVIEGRTGLTGD